MAELKKPLRTFEEINNRIKEVAPDDFLGVIRSDLIAFLPWHYAKEYLSTEGDDPVTPEKWGEAYEAYDEPTVRAKILDYLPFAWGKANDCRGISANRSIDHFLAWSWLLDEEFYTNLQNSYDNGYELYGKPQLVLVSEYMGFDWRSEDNDCWTNSEMGGGITADEYFNKSRS